jgi:hypothetical protein
LVRSRATPHLEILALRTSWLSCSDAPASYLLYGRDPVSADVPTTIAGMHIQAVCHRASVAMAQRVRCTRDRLDTA